MRILKQKKQSAPSFSYLQTLAEQAKEQRVRYRKPRAA